MSTPRPKKKPEDPDQLAFPMSDQERRDSMAYLRTLHRANRFRLMFGQPFLQETDKPRK